MNAIETHGLTKKYGAKTAADSLSFSVPEGEFFSLLGVNGAGKTTTVRMLTGLSAPTSGDALVGGHSVVRERNAVRRIIGISPQDTAVAANLTVRENLTLIGAVCGLDGAKLRARTDEMISLFGMEECAGSRAKTLSGGWQRKLSVAMALLPEPRVLFLDEPTLGLDVLARRDLWRVIEGLRGKITMVLTTHYMEEAEALSDRVAVMIAGKIAAIGSPEALREATGAKDLENAFVAIAEAAQKGGDLHA